MTRSFVPFEALWKMAIDVPYSFLVRDQDMAWSCGQLALDKNSQVIGPNDIAKQSNVVCGYIEEILDRGGVAVGSLAKLLLYYVHTGEADRKTMLSLFRKRFGSDVLLVPIGVPHYYYDGILLEVDVFCDGADQCGFSNSRNDIIIDAVSTPEHMWVSLETDTQNAGLVLPELASFLSGHKIDPAATLSEHWFVPAPKLDVLASAVNSQGPNMDSGAVINTGSDSEKINGHFVFARKGAVRQENVFDDNNNLCLLVRRSESMTWLQARSLDGTQSIVAQTDAIMNGIANKIDGMGLEFTDVVKSTTHYAGGSSASELHDNMQVRNAYYQKPGPASTGLPVFGFADRASRIVVDLTFRN